MKTITAQQIKSEMSREYQIKEQYGLKRTPTRFSREESARDYMNRQRCRAMIKGDDGYVWVVCLADMGRLMKAGLKYIR